MVRIVVAEDPRGRLCREFQLAGVAVVGVGSTSFSAVQRAKQVLPDALVIDAEVAIDGGLPAVQLIGSAAPSVGTVVYGGFNSPEWLSAAHALGLSAYVRRRCGFDDLLATVYAVASGHRLLTKETVALARQAGEVRPEHCALSLLTEPQREVVKALATGLTRREIADSLGVSAHVIDTNLAAARRALAPSVSLSAVIAALGGQTIDLRTPADLSVDQLDLTVQQRQDVGS